MNKIPSRKAGAFVPAWVRETLGFPPARAGATSQVPEDGDPDANPAQLSDVTGPTGHPSNGTRTPIAPQVGLGAPNAAKNAAATGPTRVAQVARALSAKARPSTPPPKPFADLLKAATPPVDIERVRRRAFEAGVKSGKAEIRTRSVAFLKIGAETRDSILALMLAIHGEDAAETLPALLARFRESEAPGELGMRREDYYRAR